MRAILEHGGKIIHVSRAIAGIGRQRRVVTNTSRREVVELSASSKRLASPSRVEVFHPSFTLTNMVHILSLISLQLVP